MNGHSKFFFHRTNNFFCQFDHFTSGSSSQIHQHQRLLVMYSGIPQPFTSIHNGQSSILQEFLHGHHLLYKKAYQDIP